MMRESVNFSKSHAGPFNARDSSSSAFRPDSMSIPTNDAILARKHNEQHLRTSSIKMKFPENSPYNSSKGKEFKPNQNRKDMILNAKKAEFQSQLMGSSFKFTLDGKGHMDREKAKEVIKPENMVKHGRTWAEEKNKESKNYLTQMQTLNSNTSKTRSGSLKPLDKNNSRFMTVSDSYFNKSRHTQAQNSPSQKDQDWLKNNYKFHKSTSYQIGNQPNNPSGNSVAQESFSPKKRFEAGDIVPGRRNQEASTGLRNQNKGNNINIGGNNMSVRGSDSMGGMNTRSNSMYNSNNRGQQTNQHIEANDRAKNQSNFIRSNKFEYGYDPNGGHRALSIDKLKEQKNMNGWKPKELDMFKKKSEQSNVYFSPKKNVSNAEGKRIGDTLDRFVKNEIDKNQLTRSHMPFASIKAQIQNQDPRPQINTSFGLTSSTPLVARVSLNNSPTKSPTGRKGLSVAQQLKQQAQAGNVPFAPAQRNRNDLHDRNTSLTKTTFAWKAPTMHL